MTTQQAPSPTSGPTDPSDSPSATEPSAQAEVERPRRLTGHRQRLTQLSTARPGTVVVLLRADGEADVKRPGELMIPSWLPWPGGKDALVVITEPVVLHVRVEDLLTLDGEDVASVDVDVRVRLREADLESLVGRHGDEFGVWLTESAEHHISSSVRAAVGMNRAADLRRQSLAQVLHERWLPESFGQGALTVEEFTVGAVRWPGDPDDEAQQLLEDADATPHEGRGGRARRAAHGSDLAPMLLIDSLGHRHRDTEHRSASRALELAHVPLAISVGVSWLFFISYWVPELQSFPGAHFVLEQFAPLASKELTSQSQPLVASQLDRRGLPAAMLLVVGLLLPPLARARWWLARLALWPLTYIAAIAAVVTLIGILVRGALGSNLVGVVLLVAWVGAAGVTTWRSLWVEVDTLPRRPDRVGALLVAFALVSVAPVAVGRWVFAPELRTAALSVVGNDPTLRWAALLTPTTALVYLAGISVGVVVWGVYLLWPPRRAESRGVPAAILALGLVGLLLIGPLTASAARQRATVINTESPSDEVGLGCSSWVERRPGQPARTLAISGLSCRQITAFLGYHEVVSRETQDSLSPVRADTMLGDRIKGKLVGAFYGDVVVLAVTDRFDDHATALIGLRPTDTAEIWRFTCPTSEVMRLRFAGSVEGDDAAAGRLTVTGERAGVLVDCGAGPRRLDPRTGRRS